MDFRELVKDLASVFKTRIELRQIGVRDASKLMGGLGACGRELCCHSYQSEFAPVSIRMAKEQSLSLNPGKISGMCGRLMCCLKHESETYEYLNGLLPRIGAKVTTRSGAGGYVTAVNILRQKVKVCIENGDDKEIVEYPVSELKFTSRRGDAHAIEDLGHVIDEYGERVDLSALSSLEDDDLTVISVEHDAPKQERRRAPYEKGRPRNQTNQTNQQMNQTNQTNQQRKPRGRNNGLVEQRQNRLKKNDPQTGVEAAQEITLNDNRRNEARKPKKPLSLRGRVQKPKEDASQVLPPNVAAKNNRQASADHRKRRNRNFRDK